MTMTATPPGDIEGARLLAVFGDSITTDHISPAGAIKPDSPAGRYLLEHGVEPRRVQQLRRAARQSRSDDARHLRQHPHPQPHARQCRGRLHTLRADRRDNADLRCGDGLQARRNAARDPCRQGIWHRQLARLGGQGHDPARRPRGDRRELRAHPPLEPGRHGRAPAPVPGRRECGEPRPDGRREASPSRAWPTSSRARTSR